ncbi:MAG TPA: bile acid:sodium symporter, partial [Candidatus Brocadiia bacterium]|nr:bile acid:sodium symporter [Candidatus Brocadiia bacterium]
MGTFLKKNWFLLGLFCCIVLALTFPAPGRFLDDHGAKSVSIVLIFFMSGVSIDTRRAKDDLWRWNAHVLIQTFSFGLFPAMVFWTSFWWLPAGPLKTGVLLVAVLPTTISSCVVYTAAAGGRAPCALINAVAGNLLGVVISPLLLGLLAGRQGGIDLDSAGKTMVGLCQLVLAPLLAGQVAARLSHWPVKIVGRVQRTAAPALILLILFCSFCQSAGALRGAVRDIWPVMLYLAAIHIVSVVLAKVCAAAFELPPDVRPAVVFCATQKTLSLGI